MKRRWRRSLSVACLATVLAAVDARAEVSQPYIDELKRDLPPAETTGGGSYTEEMKKKLAAGEATEPLEGEGEGYTEYLKRTTPSAPAAPSDSYTEEMKRKLGPDPDAGSAIANVDRKLEPRMEGEIRHAAGLRFGAGLSQDISGGGTAQNFQDVYNKLTLPGIGLFYEYQPFHSEWFGNIGLVASINASLNRGEGVFAVDVGYGTQSRTKFSFITLPVMIGANYRFNLLRIVRPYIQAGPTAVGYFELRSDDRDTLKGYSRAISISGGANILLDWIDRRSSWERYESAGIQHTYLTIDYTRVDTFSGDVDFALSGINLGLTFEF